MDIATLIGVLVTIVLLVGSIWYGGGSLWSFYDAPSIMIVFGGCLCATFICFPLKTLFALPKVFKIVILNKSPDPKKLIATIVSLAETARRDGLLALEGRLAEIDDDFIKLGIQMSVDGTQPEVIEDILRTEMAVVNGRHKDGKLMMDQLGRFAPAFGMVGTLMGLIMMLGNMSDPSQIGAGMAVALITTLYGAVASNGFTLPFSEKLAFLNKQELVGKEIAIRGIMALQAGENPRVIEQKLNMFLHPKLRKGAEAA